MVFDSADLGRLWVVPSGSYTMGCDSTRDLPSDADLTSCPSDERPTRTVTLTGDLYVMESEVTQKSVARPDGDGPVVFDTCGDDCPVEQVNWYEALAFANAASRSEGLAECYTLSGCTGNVGGRRVRPLRVHRRDHP